MTWLLLPNNKDLIWASGHGMNNKWLSANLLRRFLHPSCSSMASSSSAWVSEHVDRAPSRTCSTDSSKISKKLERKRRKKAAKYEARAKRSRTPEDMMKPCHLCGGKHPHLIRCQIDASRDWKFVCTKCWPRVSGGVVDGDKSRFPYYRYGGVWKLFKK